MKTLFVTMLFTVCSFAGLPDDSVVLNASNGWLFGYQIGAVYPLTKHTHGNLGTSSLTLVADSAIHPQGMDSIFIMVTYESHTIINIYFHKRFKTQVEGKTCVRKYQNLLSLKYSDWRFVPSLDTNYAFLMSNGKVHDWLNHNIMLTDGRYLLSFFILEDNNVEISLSYYNNRTQEEKDIRSLSIIEHMKTILTREDPSGWYEFIKKQYPKFSLVFLGPSCDPPFWYGLDCAPCSSCSSLECLASRELFNLFKKWQKETLESTPHEGLY